MKRGVVVIAHNTEQTDYYSLAEHAAKRVNRYLDLPVTIITDDISCLTGSGYQFDNTILVSPDSTNFRKKSIWINKGRYQVYDLSPYDETLVLDSDYMINSQALLTVFDLPSDFVCHKDVHWLLDDQKQTQEFLHSSTVQSLWATVMRFSRSSRTKQIFDMMKSIEANYEHYANIYKFMSYSYRNDYALTVALKTTNGHLEQKQDYIPWKLLHVSTRVHVYRESDTQYILMSDTGKKKSYIRIKDIDFHMLSKTNYLDLF